MHRLWHLACLALLLALTLCLLLPQTSKAYAVLLRSDPPSNAVLKAEPVQVRLWFSEDLNPTSSTASVVNSANQRMDVNGALVIPTDPREMDISLRPGLLPGVYIVIWHSQSANDGQVFSGAFPFSIANAVGSVPTPAKPLPDQSQLTTNSNQINCVTIFRWLIAALVDLCVIFWISGKVWHNFVLDPAGSETAQQREIAQLSQQRFAQRYSLPILRVLFLANIGVLAGQALSLTSGRWDLILSPILLVGLLTNGSFGIFWLTGEVVIALAIMLETIVLFSRQHTPDSTNNDTSSWLDLLLCLLLLILTTLTGYTSANSITPEILTLLVGGLYLLAATLWLGGIFYLALVYLPILHDKSSVGPQPLRLPMNSREMVSNRGNLKGCGPTDGRNRPTSECALSLLTILQRFSPLAISAAIIMILSGTYNVIMHQTSFDQLRAPVYEPVLIVEIVCCIVLLIASAWLFFLLQPSLVKDYEQHECECNLTAGTDLSCPRESTEQSPGHDKSVPAVRLGIHQQNSEEVQGSDVAAKVQEQSIVRHINRLSIVLRYMLLPAIIVILCMGLMSILVGGF
jgi:copper transport protein